MILRWRDHLSLSGWAQFNHKGPLYKEEVVGSQARGREGYVMKTEVRERERER